MSAWIQLQSEKDLLKNILVDVTCKFNKLDFLPLPSGPMAPGARPVTKLVAEITQKEIWKWFMVGFVSAIVQMNPGLW